MPHLRPSSSSWQQRRDVSARACLALLLLAFALPPTRPEVAAVASAASGSPATATTAEAAAGQAKASGPSALTAAPTAELGSTSIRHAGSRAVGPAGPASASVQQHAGAATALHGTANADYNKTYSALCVVAKDENRYIAEWVQYHKCLGAGKIYLYDHNSRKPMSEEIQSFVDEGYVQYIPFQGQHVRWQQNVVADNLTKFGSTIQGNAYMDCLARFADLHTFIGFIDVDEFIVLHDQSVRHLDDLLKRYEPYGGVSFYWIMFGSGGHKVPPAGWVTHSYLKCLPRHRGQNTQFKTFVNTAYRPTMYSPHRAMFDVPGDTSFMVDENLDRIPPGRNKNSTHKVAAIYHYATKSHKEFNIKRMRGGGAGVTRPRYFLRNLDKACTETCYDAALLYARLCGKAAKE